MSTDGGLRGIYRQYLPSVHWTTVETAYTEPGVPDINGCFHSCEFWIENKQTQGWHVSLRPEQIGWMLRRTRAGGNTFIAVRRHCKAGARREQADELWLFMGAHAAVLQEHGLKDTPCRGVWCGGPAKWDWTVVSKVLVPQQ